MFTVKFVSVACSPSTAWLPPDTNPAIARFPVNGLFSGFLVDAVVRVSSVRPLPKPPQAP